MVILDKKSFWKAGLILSVVSFILLFSGVRWILGNDVTFKNIIAYAGFSFAVGLIVSILLFLQLKTAFIMLSLGLAVGFFEMFRSFINKMSGWGDLVGLLSLFVWTVIGLGAGILVQLAVYLIKRLKRGSA